MKTKHHIIIISSLVLSEIAVGFAFRKLYVLPMVPYIGAGIIFMLLYTAKKMDRTGKIRTDQLYSESNDKTEGVLLAYWLSLLITTMLMFFVLGEIMKKNM